MAVHKGIRFPRMNVPRWLVIVLIVVLGSWLLVEINLRPVITELSESRVKAVAVTAMSDTILDTIGQLEYSDLVEVKYDDNGNISMLQANTVNINKLSHQVTRAVQERIGELGRLGVDVPVGAILGGPLVAGEGPALHVSIVPAGTVSTEFKSEFTGAGINQTRHRLILVMKAAMRVVAPVGGGYVEAVSQVPVAETIIVGKVPDSYVNVDETEKMLNLLPD